MSYKEIMTNRNGKRYDAIDVKRPLPGPICYFLNSSDAEFLEICMAMLSSVIIEDLQKIHFAPNGFVADTS